MPYYHFFWNEEIEEYLLQHGIGYQEFESIVSAPDAVGLSRSSGLPIAFGWTATGKYIACVYEADDDGITIYPKTAYEIEP